MIIGLDEWMDIKMTAKVMVELTVDMSKVDFWAHCNQEAPMKRTRFTENQIITILKEGEASVKVKDIWALP